MYQQAKCKTLVKEVEQNLINCQPVIVLEYLANPFRPCWDLARDGRTAHAIEDVLAFDSRLEASKVPRSSARGSFPHLGGRMAAPGLVEVEVRGSMPLTKYVYFEASACPKQLKPSIFTVLCWAVSLIQGK